MVVIGVMNNGYTTTESVKTASRSNGFIGFVFELEKYAFPNELANKINKESDFVSVRGVCAVVNCLNTHNDVELVADINGKVPICINCLEKK